jgi:hypothetical protein
LNLRLMHHAGTVKVCLEASLTWKCIWSAQVMWVWCQTGSLSVPQPVCLGRGGRTGCQGPSLLGDIPDDGLHMARQISCVGNLDPGVSVWRGGNHLWKVVGFGGVRPGEGGRMGPRWSGFAVKLSPLYDAARSPCQITNRRWRRALGLPIFPTAS